MSATTDAPAPTEQAETPPWGDEFDAERAWTLVQNLRRDKESLQEKLTAAETERDEQRTAAEQASARATTADRSLWTERAARKHGIAPEFADFLTGDTEDEINTRAERFASARAASIAAAPTEQPAEALPPRPAPALSPGHGVQPAEPAFDAAAIARRVRGE